MGYAMCMGSCLICKQVFSFNPMKVPSLNGEPICKACIDRANPLRKEKGLPPIIPAPDAYEACPEEELHY